MNIGSESLPKIFLIFLFFLHIVIVLRKKKSKSRKFTYFRLFASNSSIRTSFRPMQGFGEAGIDKNGMIIKTLIIKMKYLTTLLI